MSTLSFSAIAIAAVIGCAVASACTGSTGILALIVTACFVALVLDFATSLRLAYNSDKKAKRPWLKPIIELAVGIALIAIGFIWVLPYLSEGHL